MPDIYINGTDIKTPYWLWEDTGGEVVQALRRVDWEGAVEALARYEYEQGMREFYVPWSGLDEDSHYRLGYAADVKLRAALGMKRPQCRMGPQFCGKYVRREGDLCKSHDHWRDDHP